MKKRGSILLICICFYIYISFVSLAADSYRSISSIRIKVGDALSSLSVGDNWPSTIDRSDFESGNETQYEIDSVRWYGDTDVESVTAGGTRQVMLTLNALSRGKGNGDEIIYQFTSAYSANNVRIVGGEFISAKRNGSYGLELIFSLSPAKGQYSEVENLAWSSNALGTATWSAPDNTSGVYEVMLSRDGARQTTITTDALSLNLYPWMTVAGNYTFSVTTIPYTEEQQKYARKSGVRDSDGLTITDANRSNGSGQYDSVQITASSTDASSAVSTDNPIGWYQSNGVWYFRYPDGKLALNTWLSWNGHWYHFDTSGLMQTGWYQSPYGNWFYLDPVNGYAKKSWQYISGYWYYFHTEAGEQEAVMYHSTMVDINGKTYYFAPNGQMQTGWHSIRDQAGRDRYYYFNADGAILRNTTVNGFVLGADGAWVQ